MDDPFPFIRRLKDVIIGRSRSLYDQSVFHKLSLVAFFAWVGLGADGLSSSCYGPAEAFNALGQYIYLAVFVALATAVTIFVICASYSQIIELFPSGGGGYVVASKLLSPRLGVIAGSALVVDYVLTITISIASGADAVFSFLPVGWYKYRLVAAVAGVIFLTVLNLRGVRESVLPLVPVFLLFLGTHAFAIIYGLADHFLGLPEVAARTVSQVRTVGAQVGFWGLAFLVMRAYTLGAGTYTGIEAVSNGLPILREPRVKTGKETLNYMKWSLAAVVVGLIIVYLLYRVAEAPGKTLNAVLFESITTRWPPTLATAFVLVTLASEAAILFVAAQAGFLGGPRVLANLAVDSWAPTKFANLSDRLVTKNGILLMGGGAVVTMLLTGGSVRFLVVLYSINVFITFALSQLGMVRHWWEARGRTRHWGRKLFVTGLGLVVTTGILLSVIILKFYDGGWITLFVTSTLVVAAFLIKRHYEHIRRLLRRLDILVEAARAAMEDARAKPAPAAAYDARAKTAVILVNGFNGVGLHTLFNVTRLFGAAYKNFIFVQIGIVDAGNFKGAEQVDKLGQQVMSDLNQYVEYMKSQGYYADSYWAVGTDVVEEVTKLADQILARFPNATFFGGQLVFEEDPVFSRWLHNFTVFAVQRRFYLHGIPFIILPVRVQREKPPANNNGRRRHGVAVAAGPNAGRGC